MAELEHRKRIEIVAEAALLRRLQERIDGIGVTGYTLIPVMGGRGHVGEWSRAGQVSRVHEMVMLVCLTTEDRADDILDAVIPLLERGSGVLNIGDVAVVRGDKF